MNWNWRSSLIMMTGDTDVLAQDRFPDLFHDHGPNPPRHLLTQRLRSSIVRVGHGWPSAAYTGLPIPLSKLDVAIAAGAEAAPPFKGHKRLAVVRAQAKGFQEFMPFVNVRAYRPFAFQLIPSTSYGSSLKNLMTPDGWQEFSAQALLNAGHVCEFCGDGEHPLEAHEIWEFHTPLHADVEGIQKLVQLVAVCDDCHDIFHPPNARRKGNYQASLDRMSTLNGWRPDEAQEFVAWLTEIQRFRSQFDWVLDLSAFAQGQPLKMGNNWVIDERTGRFKCIDERIASIGRNQTLPIGIHLSIQGEDIMPEPVEAYYDLLLFPAEGLEDHDENSDNVPA